MAAGLPRSAAGQLPEVRRRPAAALSRSAAARRSTGEPRSRRTKHRLAGRPTPRRPGSIPSQNHSSPRHGANPTSPHPGRQIPVRPSGAQIEPRRRSRAIPHRPTRACTSRDAGRCRASLRLRASHRRARHRRANLQLRARRHPRASRRRANLQLRARRHPRARLHRVLPRPGQRSRSPAPLRRR